MASGDCRELKAGFPRMETGLQRKGREREVTRKRAWSPATPGLFSSRAPAQSKRPENTRQLCFSLLLVPLLLETGTGHKAASTSTRVQYQEVAPPLWPPEAPPTLPWGLRLDRDSTSTGLGVLCTRGDPQSDDQSEARRNPGSARLSFRCRFQTSRV